jgi:hypothetical protein
MYEEGANLSTIDQRIEQIVSPAFCLIATEQRFPIAPAAASDNLAGSRFNGEERFIRDELAVHSEDGPKGARDLLWRVVAGLQSGYG